MGAAAIGVTEKKDDEQGIDQQDIFYRMILFLAALTRGLFKRVLGADDAPFGTIMGKRGEAGVGVGSSSSGVTTAAASASETPRRWARAVRNGRGHRRGHAAPRAARGGGRASTDWLCFGPSRTNVRARPGVPRFEGRPE
jgi:hypothetical protein